MGTTGNKEIEGQTNFVLLFCFVPLSFLGSSERLRLGANISHVLHGYKISQVTKISEPFLNCKSLVKRTACLIPDLEGKGEIFYFNIHAKC